MLQIASNGLMSSSAMLKDLNLFAEFPRESAPLLPLIAPLWANFRKPLTIHYRVTGDPNTLQQVTEMIAYRNPELRDYQPSLAVVATVENAKLTFQDLRVSTLA